MSRAFRDLRRDEPPERAPMKVLLLLRCVLIGAVVSAPVSRVRAEQSDYYVRLPKLGVIRGVRAPSGQSSGEQPVVSFLNIAYAAPPTGPLRLMPPGAVQAGQGGPIERERLLLPGTQKSPVRGHAQFGPRCVHLADWLEERAGETGNFIANSSISDNNDKSAQSTNNATYFRERARKRFQQSEDCLNLNVFVPLDESVEREKQAAMIKQQIKSNYPAPHQRQRQRNAQPETEMKTKMETNGKSSIIKSIRNAHIVSTNRADERNQDNQEDSGDLVNQAKSEADQPGAEFGVEPAPLWPLALQQTSSGSQTGRKAVLVLLHGLAGSHQANTFDHLALARRAQCILVTFNYRLGLLGFLPYTDRSADGKLALPRNNYAIWDQIGLLHWIKHNIAAFNGNPNNITIMAADNQASLFLQLLIMSPLTKGLFNKAIIVHDETRQQEANSNLDRLLATANKARDLRRQLTAILSQVIQATLVTSNKQQQVDSLNSQYQQTDGNLIDERVAFDYIQSASLQQLASVERGLRRQASQSNSQLLDLAFAPNLDDKLLFPQLSPLLKAGQLDFGQQSLANLTHIRSEANYCLYVSQLYANGFDRLGLIGSKSSERGSTVSKYHHNSDNIHSSGSAVQLRASNNWHRDLNLSKVHATNSKASIYKRSVLATQFNHLHHIHLLNELLNAFNQEDRPLNQITAREVGASSDSTQVGVDDGDDEDSPARRQQDASGLLRGDIGQSMKRSPHLAETLSDVESSLQKLRHPLNKRSLNRDSSYSRDLDNDQLIDPIGSVDLMIGFFKSNSSPRIDSPSNFPYHVNAKYNNVAAALIEATGFNQQFLDLLKFAELHFIASLSVDNTLGQYCDFYSSNRATKLAKSNFVFLVDNTSSQNNQNYDDWFSRGIGNMNLLTDGVVNFIRFGNPNNVVPNTTSGLISNPDSYWPVYEPLNHHLKSFLYIPDSSEQNTTPRIKATESSHSLKKQIQVHLDVLPYLNSLSWSQQSPISSNVAASHNNSSFYPSEQMDLFTCLNEIDSAINKNRLSLGQQVLSNNRLDDLIWRCLIGSALRIRAHLRQYAADDLEPLNRLIRQQLVNDAHLQPASSSITTRNLVDDGTPIIDSIDTQRQQNILPDSGLTASSTSVVSQTTVTNTGIKGFLAGAYKDAVGKALTIVVGTGLSVFLLNLLVILIITWRSAQVRRRAANNQTRVHDSGTIENVANGFGQPIKKSTLKKSNLQQSLDEECVGKVLEELQLMTSVHGACSNVESRTKQLKFDLPGEIEVNSPIECHQDSTFSTFPLERTQEEVVYEHHMTAPLFMSSPIDPSNLSDNQQVQSYAPNDLDMEKAINNLNTNTAGNEILLRPEQLNCYYGDLNRAELLHNSSVNVKCASYEPISNGSSVEWNQIETASSHYGTNRYGALNHHHSCGLSTSPITNQSHSTTTTTTCTNNTTSTNLSSQRQQQQQQQQQQQHYQKRPMIQRSTISAYGGNIRQQHTRYLDHSAASPSSSTTLSMTPIQLEPIAAIAGCTSNAHYQLEPIGLLYQASDIEQVTSSDPAQMIEQSEEFLADKMFLISSPQPTFDAVNHQQQVSHLHTLKYKQDNSY